MSDDIRKKQVRSKGGDGIKDPIEVPLEKVVVVHHCTEKETLNRLSMLLVGNGNPEDGYVYRVIEMSKEVKNINDKLTGISGIVKELHDESVGQRASVKTIRERRTGWVKIAMFIIGAISLLFIAYNSFRQDKRTTKIEETTSKTETKIDDIGKPFITNSRGEPIAFKDTTRIYYWPNDSSFVYIIKKVKNE